MAWQDYQPKRARLIYNHSDFGVQVQICKVCSLQLTLCGSAGW